MLSILLASSSFIEDPNQPEQKIVVQDLCWSPNGTYIYFSAMKVNADYSNYSGELWTVYQYNLASKKLIPIIESAVYVAVSPSGKTLAVSKYNNNNKNIYLYDYQGGSPSPLIEEEYKVFAPTWSPDGNRIAYVSTQTGNEEIFVINHDGTNPVQVTNSNGYKAYNPIWSPDGRHIVYYLAKGDGKDQIYVMTADGKYNRNLTNDDYNNIFPGWVNENTIIYGQAEKDKPTKLYQVNLDGRHKRPVMDINSFYGRYSPNHALISYVDESKGKIHIVLKSGYKVDTIDISL